MAIAENYVADMLDLHLLTNTLEVVAKCVYIFECMLNEYA